MPPRSSRRVSVRRHAIAAAAAALLALPAHAQFYGVSGSVSGAPFNPFPGLNPALPVLDMTGSGVYVGGGGLSGSFSVMAGAQFTADFLDFGSGLGNGTGLITGAGTVARLVGDPSNRLTVGNWGNGVLIVNDGARLDASGPCASYICNTFIGNLAGSSASFVVAGAGSEASFNSAFVVAGAAVFGNVSVGFQGTPGGQTNSTVGVQLGALLRTNGVTISAGPGGSSPTGTERTFANVDISGAGSQWIVTPNQGGSTASFNTSTHANAQSTVVVGAGGQLILDGTAPGANASLLIGNGGQSNFFVLAGGKVYVSGSGSGPDSHIGVGWGAGSNGVLNVDGAGSLLALSGHVSNLDIGSGALASGSLNVTGGGRVTAGGLNIGSFGATGAVVIDNGTVELNNGIYGRLTVGNSSNGTLSIVNGGLLDATVNANACLGTWCGNFVGFRAGSAATLNISGTGSELRVLRSLDIANTWVDAFGGTPGATSTATINITDGGTLRSNSVSAGAGSAWTGFQGNGSEQSISHITIDGAGSRWIATSNTLDNINADFSLGSQSLAQSFLTISNGGLLRIDGTANNASASLSIGNAAGGSGAVTVTGAGSALQVIGGAYANVNADAQSTITVSNGGQFIVDGSAGGAGGGMRIGFGGQSTFVVQSGGKVSLDGASGNNGSWVGIGGGLGSSGTLNITGPSSEFNVNGSHGWMGVGWANGGTGFLSVADGGKLSVGNLSIGQAATGVAQVNGGTVQIGGADGRLLIGDWGTGSLHIGGGGVVDATLSPLNCVGGWCANVLAINAGATGTLSIDGAGSELRVIRSFELANAWVGPSWGTPGGTSTATLSITGGGSLRSNYVFAGTAGGPDALGTERSFATITIDGPGSQWIVTSNTLDGGGAGFYLSSHANAQSFMTLSNGGLLQIDSSADGKWANLTVGNGGQATFEILSGGKVAVGGAMGGNGSSVNVGWGAGSTGVLTIGGTGSALQMTGSHANLTVGGNGGGSGWVYITSGGSATVGGLTIGNNGTGVVNVNGGTLLINGTDGRLNVGSPGNGRLNVIGGGVVDATLNAASCVGMWCGTAIGNSAGGTGTLLISGAGSEVRLVRNLFVGVPRVDGAGGLPGASATASISVLDGGSLRTQSTFMGQGPGGSGALGTERSFVTAVVDGPGSQWIVTPNSVDGSAAYLGLATHANGTVDMTVSGGGLLRVDGRVGSTGPNDGLSIAPAGKATLTVTGVGSRVETMGRGPFINVGSNSVTSDGSFSVLAGATAQTIRMNVGRNGAHGNLLIDGAGSQVTLSGVSNEPASTFVAGISVGRLGGTGTATVSHGGRLFITDGGQDARPTSSSVALLVAQDAGSTGSLVISGAGSTVEIVSTSLGLAPGVADNFNPFVAIGYNNTGATMGTLNVNSGGKLIMTGNAVSTVAVGRATSLNIGGRNGGIGTGTATVTGAGSEIIVQGYDAYVGVGRTAGSSGTLNVLDQGKLSSTSLAVGNSTSGNVNVDNATIALSGYRTDSSQVGAGGTVGRGAGGVGSLALSNGAVMTISPSVLTGGLSIGGDQFFSGGTGTVSLSSGSSLLFGGSTTSSLRIGRTGNGTMVLSGASLVDVGLGGAAYLADAAGGSGQLNVSGGSKFIANQIGIGGTSDSATGGTATATFSGAGSELRAQGASGFVGVGWRGLGTLSLTDQAQLNGIVTNVGRGADGVGTLVADNASISMVGQQSSGAMSGAAFAVGNRGGVGFASLANGTQLSIVNSGSNGASLNVGGTPLNPLGSGTLNVSGGSHVTVAAAPGQAIARIGHDGTGTASFSGGSTLDVGDGQVIIAGQPGSTGTLTLNSGSTLNASYVGIGSLPGGIDGGNGKLFVNDSTVNATTVEIGTHSLLGGTNGVIHGNVIVRGVLSPGNSPGRLVIDGGLTIDGPGRLVIDVADNGAGGYNVDELVLTQGSAFDLSTVVVDFNFLGNTDPNAFAATGKLDLDTFIKVADSNGNESGLSSTFAAGTTWNTVLAQATFTATANNFSVNLNLDNSGGGTFNISAVPVPEPGTWALWLGGLALLAARGWRRRAA